MRTGDRTVEELAQLDADGYRPLRLPAVEIASAGPLV
jgi:hypothetical protein